MAAESCLQEGHSGTHALLKVSSRKKFSLHSQTSPVSEHNYINCQMGSNQYYRLVYSRCIIIIIGASVVRQLMVNLYSVASILDTGISFTRRRARGCSTAMKRAWLSAAIYRSPFSSSCSLPVRLHSYS